ncbi:hypothetical protein BS17DRAFT_96253 [Gyrodon lividus]|nr:hypothetical protein BS17DRAFT_96253 [Gyrodon lividus]
MMDYSDYSQQPQQQSQSSPQRNWPTQLLTPATQQPQSTSQQPPFPSPASPSPYFFPGQNQTPQQQQQQQQQPGCQQTSPSNDSRPTSSALSLNISALSVASPTILSPIGPHQAQSGPFHPHQLQSHHPAHPIPHHPHHAHSHSHSSGSALSVSPITPVSPLNFSPSHLSSQPTFSFNFEDGLAPNSGAGGLSPTPDSLLAQRRPSTGSHSTSSSELAIDKSVPRKRSLTNALPVSQSSVLGGHSMHHHSHSHSYTPTQQRQAGAHHTHPHPIITTTASSPPPPTSPTSPSSSHPSHSHSHSLSHSHSHSSLSHSSFSQAHSPQQPHPTRIDINAHPTSPYEDIDSAGAGYTVLGDEASEDEFGSGSFTGGGSFGILFVSLFIRADFSLVCVVDQI